MFLKQKCNGRVKRRYCADGRKQRLWKSKKDSASPTVSIGVVFITAVIESMKGREVDVHDIPGAFLMANIDELIFMLLSRELLETLLKSNRELYSKYATLNPCRNKILYILLKKALYGCLQSAMHF